MYQVIWAVWKVDELDVLELECRWITYPCRFKKIDVVVNDVVKKTVYNELVKKVNAIDTSKPANKTDYNAKTKDIEDKILSITNLATIVLLMLMSIIYRTLVLYWKKASNRNVNLMNQKPLKISRTPY